MMDGTWELVEPAPFANRVGAVCVADDDNEHVYIIGDADCGWASGVVERWNLTHNSSSSSFTTLPPLNCPRESFAAARVGEEIYVFGGRATELYDDFSSNPSGECLSSTTFVEHVEVFHTKNSNKWKILDKTPEFMQLKCNHSAVAVGDDDIYIIGGEGEDGCENTIDIFHTKSQSWERSLPPMKQARKGLAAVAIANQIFIMGGRNEQDCLLDTMECYDLSSKTWRTLPPMMHAREEFVAVAVGGNILTVGGGIDTIHVYNIVQQKWTELANKTQTTSSWGCAATSIQGRVFVTGRGTAEVFTLSNKAGQLPTNNTDNVDSENKLLCMDGANFLRNFFSFGRPWNLQEAEKKVHKFCSACHASGWTLVVFFDQAVMTDEAQSKWRKRREREVRRRERQMPQGALRLVGEMMMDCGVQVWYSKEADCDDTIAFYAQAHQASVLSQDSDFFRYRGASYALYKDYRFAAGKTIKLVPHDGVRKASWRAIGPPPEVGECNPFRDCVEEGRYLRGTPSPLIGMGNLHIHVRALRVALYSWLGTGQVEEEFPTLVDNKCVWNKEAVQSDESCLELLQSPVKALARFQQERPSNVSDEDWYKHQFALRAVVAELCCTYSGNTLLHTLKLLMRDVSRPSTKASKTRTKKQKGSKKTTHYLEWRNSQPEGESNKEKRERYLQLFSPGSPTLTRQDNHELPQKN